MLRVLSYVGEKHDEILRGIAGIKEELQEVSVYLKTQNSFKEIIVLLVCQEVCSTLQKYSYPLMW